MADSQLEIKQPVLNAYIELINIQGLFEDIFYDMLNIADAGLSWAPESVKKDLGEDLAKAHVRYHEVSSDRRKASSWLRQEIGILLGEEWALKKDRS